MRRRHDRAGRIDGWGNDVHMPVEKGRAPRFRFRMTPDDGAGSIEAEFGGQPIDGLQHLFVGREPRGGNNPVDSRNFTTELPRIGPRVEDVGEVPSQGHDLFIVVSVLDVRDQALQRRPTCPDLRAFDDQRRMSSCRTAMRWSSHAA
jgi:hypothetical protein